MCYLKFPKFLCHSLTTDRNFYSSPSPSALIQESQRDFHDRKHCWKSFCVHVFIASCDSVWIYSMLQKHGNLSFNFMHRKKHIPTHSRMPLGRLFHKRVELAISIDAKLYLKRFSRGIPISGTFG
jgi:hypothetical protein